VDRKCLALVHTSTHHTLVTICWQGCGCTSLPCVLQYSTTSPPWGTVYGVGCRLSTTQSTSDHRNPPLAFTPSCFGDTAMHPRRRHPRRHRPMRSRPAHPRCSRSTRCSRTCRTLPSLSQGCVAVVPPSPLPPPPILPSSVTARGWLIPTGPRHSLVCCGCVV
jgi:hypothetical protein